MRLFQFLTYIPVAAALMFAAGPAKAALIEYRVSGTITDVNLGLTDISVGDLFEFSAIIETATPDLEPDPVLGLYLLAVQDFSFSVGAFTGGGDGGGSQVQVIEDPALERVALLQNADPARSNGMPDGFDFSAILLEFLNNFNPAQPGALSSDALGPALVASQAGPFAEANAVFGVGPVFGDGARRTASGPIDLVQIFDVPTGIPEPASLALFGVGLAGLGFLGRRRKRH